MKLEAFKYYYIPAGAVGVAGICAKPTPEIPQAASGNHRCREAVHVGNRAIGAVTAGHDDPATDAAMIQYVSTFVPKASGENFNPHVSTGVAPREYLDKMLAEPFEPFTFPRRAQPFTNSARSARRRRNSKSGIKSLEAGEWHMFPDEHSLIGFRPDIWDLIAFASMIGAIVLEKRISEKEGRKAVMAFAFEKVRCSGVRNDSNR